MRRLNALLIGAIAAIAAACSGATAASAPLVDIGAGLHGPAGLAATVYATGLPNVSAFAFDGDGRLWAATAAFEDAQTDAVYLVTAAGAAPTKVIADTHTPLGLVWSGGTLYVSSHGQVDAYSAFDGHAFGTHVVVVTFPAGVGEVNGMVMSPEGRLVVGISAPCDACKPTSGDAAAVVSILPDGTDLRVEASGIRAPVGLVYVPGTADLLVTMNQRDDLGDATPGDWLSIVRAGQDWRFPDCYGQGGTACEGAPTPLAVLDKHAAASSVAVVTGRVGSAFGPSAVVAEWAKGVVMRAALPSDSATTATAPSTTATLFLTGFKQPVAIVAAPYGALFVGDWGTGKIYRIDAA